MTTAIPIHMPTYGYGKLVERPRPEIRLLEVLSNDRYNHLTCKLIHTELMGNYTALSYQWGSPTPKFPVQIIDDHGQVGLIYVGSNLHDFLQQAQTLDQGRQFWIDALCIDQDNTAEKNTQVSRMGEIYSKAEDVRIWLGEDNDTASILSTISKVARETTLPIQELFEYGMCPTEYADVFAQHRRKAFLQNAYWSRTWIVQEVLLAREIKVQSGSGMTAWSNIVGLNAPMSDQQSPFMQRILGDWRANSDPATGNSVRHYPLIATLDAFKENECQNTLDHIYGFRALIIDGDKIEVDYKKTPEQLLREVVSIFKLSSDVIETVLAALKLDSRALILNVPFVDIWRAQKILSENPIFLGNGISRRNKKHGFPLCQDEVEQCQWSRIGQGQPCKLYCNVGKKMAEMDAFQIEWCVEASQRIHRNPK